MNRNKVVMIISWLLVLNIYLKEDSNFWMKECFLNSLKELSVYESLDFINYLRMDRKTFQELLRMRIRDSRGLHNNFEVFGDWKKL